MDFQKILAALKGVTDGAEAVAGPLAALGIPYANLVNAGLKVAQNLEQRAAEGAVVMTSEDHDQVKQIITDLEAVNDDLARKIDAS